MTPLRVPRHVAGIAPYVPGRPIEDVERELGLHGTIKLASNENPLGPSPLAVEAIRQAASSLHRYPDGAGTFLREKIASMWGVSTGHVILGNGSSEIVELLARTFLGPGGIAVISEQAFVMYRIAVTAANGLIRLVPLRAMRHDLRAMAGAVTPEVRLLYVANPNNPTGTHVGREDYEAMFERLPSDVLVVLDEAYAEYVDAADYPAGIDDLKAGRNVAVLRTFSKIHGLAGVRIGYALTRPEVAEQVEKVRSPFNTSSLAQAAALAALDDAGHLRASRETNLAEREFVRAELTRRGRAFTPTVANFHLVDVGRPAGPVYDALLRRGVIVRPMAAYNFPTGLRVTIGTRAENERFLEALDAVLGGGADRAVTP